MKIVAIIPARGGSKGIPGKNIRILAGKPLISYPISAAINSKYINEVVVTTDCEQIAHISELYGASVLMRPNKLATDSISLDPVVFHAVKSLEQSNNYHYDIVLTIQATSPMISTSTIDHCIKNFINNDNDTLITVVDDRHLSWTKEKSTYIPNYLERVNRQLLPMNFRETGGVMVSKRNIVSENSRIGTNVDLFEVPIDESIDIDTAYDWWIAEKLKCRRKILFRVDGYSEIGMGHIYRTLQLAYRLIDHELYFLTDGHYILGLEKLNASNFNVYSFTNEDEEFEIISNISPDIIVTDILDTKVDYMQKVKEYGIFLVSFEDVGPGAIFADVVINALYEKQNKIFNQFWGKKYFCLKDEFHIQKSKPISEKVKNILITFGGTDPNDYTKRLVKILMDSKIDCKVTVILGLGYKKEKGLKDEFKNVIFLNNVSNISKYMVDSDLVLTSAGRTVYEIASLGIPCIVLAQNERELHHTFASSSNGIINLGLGYEKSNVEILNTITKVCNDYNLRRNNQVLMLGSDLKSGIHNVLHLINDKYKEWENINGRNN